ncbi:hypothetical protein PY093_04815 [Cytobacillus sp. S13-E01]|uniref:hypothetical protein n=1 Tax=Cytobacillus sp. S13-E01 TaxID=3031326 RepID=UPI0023D87A70|nr:hypothetical protein [Cytobacillus sp. S13-E01]MDF0726033.1 hypothetical protein [Cytobacillus sp. S13-E01]
MIKNILFIGIIVEIILFSLIIWNKETPKPVTSAPVKQTAGFETKTVPNSFVSQVTDDQQVVPAGNTSTSLPNIKLKYQSQFKLLEQETQDKLFELAVSAYDDYIQGDQDIVSLLSMTKYAKELKALEQVTDDAFYMLYDELEKELVYNGYATSDASEFKTEYEAKKESQVKELIKMATSEISGF